MRILIKEANIIGGDVASGTKGSIAIEEDTIKHVGYIPSDFSADTVIDGSRFIAMPGMVNAHTHSPMGVLRNLADDLPFSDWLFGKIIPAESKLTETDVYWGAMLGIAEMLKAGVTCFADMYIHMDAIVQAVCETGIRANLSCGPITSDVRGNGLIVDTEKCSSFVKKWEGAENGKIKTSVEIHSVYLFDKASITEAAALAKSLDMGIHIHLSESEAELSMSNEKYRVSPIRAAFEMGVFETPVIAAHCVHLTDEDIKILKNASVSPVHCPSSNFKLGNGLAPVQRLADMDINVCLGTDGSASNNNLNMLEEMHLAALIHKGFNKDPEIMPASLVMKMAAENGAKALGFKSGKIAEGYKADIVLINAEKPHICPVNDPLSAVVYSAQAADVDTVLVDGKILLQNGELLNMDTELIMNKVKEIAARIKA